MLENVRQIGFWIYPEAQLHSVVLSARPFRVYSASNLPTRLQHTPLKLPSLQALVKSAAAWQSTACPRPGASSPVQRGFPRSGVRPAVHGGWGRRDQLEV